MKKRTETQLEQAVDFWQMLFDKVVASTPRAYSNSNDPTNQVPMFESSFRNEATGVGDLGSRFPPMQLY